MLENYTVLSRKYRPAKLADVVGQELVTQAIQTCLRRSAVPHAFLFYGIRGVGKTTLARILAKCLCCLESQDPAAACEHCKSCESFNSGAHLDITEVDAASRTGVEDIREIIDACQYSPIFGKYKIFIIDEIHMLSKSAFNALLKTLEEPPAHVKFMFATTEINKIPETILSRCITFHLKPIHLDKIEKHLLNIAKKEGFTLQPEAAKILAEESEGSVRDALSMLTQGLLVSQNNIIESDTIIKMLGGVKSSVIEKLLHLIIAGQPQEALAEIENIYNNGGDSYEIFRHLQKALYLKITEIVRNAKTSENQNSLSKLLYLWQILLNQSDLMKASDNPNLVLNAAIIIMSHTAQFPNIAELNINNQEKILNKNSNTLVNDILSLFPGSSSMEIE